MLCKRERAERDRLARRLVAGDDQQRERVVQLALGQRPPVQLGDGDPGEDVVARALATVGGVLAAQWSTSPCARAAPSRCETRPRSHSSYFRTAPGVKLVEISRR